MNNHIIICYYDDIISNDGRIIIAINGHPSKKQLKNIRDMSMNNMICKKLSDVYWRQYFSPICAINELYAQYIFKVPSWGFLNAFHSTNIRHYMNKYINIMSVKQNHSVKQWSSRLLSHHKRTLVSNILKVSKLKCMIEETINDKRAVSKSIKCKKRWRKLKNILLFYIRLNQILFTRLKCRKEIQLSKVINVLDCSNCIISDTWLLNDLPKSDLLKSYIKKYIVIRHRKFIFGSKYLDIDSFVCHSGDKYDRGDLFSKLYLRSIHLDVMNIIPDDVFKIILEYLKDDIIDV